MRSADGSILEVFEWKSQEAINNAHTNENVLELWKRFEEVCEYKNFQIWKNQNIYFRDSNQ